MVLLLGGLCHGMSETWVSRWFLHIVVARRPGRRSGGCVSPGACGRSRSCSNGRVRHSGATPGGSCRQLCLLRWWPVMKALQTSRRLQTDSRDAIQGGQCASFARLAFKASLPCRTSERARNIDAAARCKTPISKDPESKDCKRARWHGHSTENIAQLCVAPTQRDGRRASRALGFRAD